MVVEIVLCPRIRCMQGDNSVENGSVCLRAESAVVARYCTVNVDANRKCSHPVVDVCRQFSNSMPSILCVMMCSIMSVGNVLCSRNKQLFAEVSTTFINTVGCMIVHTQLHAHVNNATVVI